MKKMTRKEMWKRFDQIKKDHPNERDVQSIKFFLLHREYYGQIVKKFNILPPLHLIDLCREDLRFGDAHFNRSTRISMWPRLSVYQNKDIHRFMRELGDSLSLANEVCISKEAMRQFLESDPPRT
jgi:hypothetical protein